MKTDLVVGAYIVHNHRVLLIHHRKLDLWLPVGGHIEQNETPDDAVLRECREEVGLDVIILNESDIPSEGNIKKILSVPFCVNVHPVGDHDHCCFFYVCIPSNPEQLKVNKEVKDYKWFSKEELYENYVPLDVRNLALKALALYQS